MRSELDGNGTEAGEVARKWVNQADSEDGRYWARTSDPELVDPMRAFPAGSI